MCNCGRQNTEVITSAQAQEDQAARAAQDAENQQVSASNAVSNATSGWFSVETSPA
jgi:hypothetical protein